MDRPETHASERGREGWRERERERERREGGREGESVCGGEGVGEGEGDSQRAIIAGRIADDVIDFGFIRQPFQRNGQSVLELLHLVRLFANLESAPGESVTFSY